MVFSRGLVISLGVSALSATLLFLYFRNRMASVERKVDVMFDLIQSHEVDRQNLVNQQMMMQQNNAPSSQNTGDWNRQNITSEKNLIEVSDDEEDDINISIKNRKKAFSPGNKYANFLPINAVSGSSFTLIKYTICFDKIAFFTR